MSIKSRFSNPEIFINELKQKLPDLTTQILHELGDKEKSYKIIQWIRIPTFISIFGICIFILFLPPFSDFIHLSQTETLARAIIEFPFAAFFIGIFLLCIMTSIILYLVRKNTLIKKFEKVYDALLLDSIGALFQKSIVSVYDKKVEKDVLKNIQESELFIRKKSFFSLGKIFHLSSGMHNKEMTLAQMSYSEKYGKRESEVFRGYFVIFPLKQKQTGKTLVVSREKFKNVWRAPLPTLFKNMIFPEHNHLEHVDLEWSQFEDVLEVRSDDQVGARIILSPDFMADLYDWWVMNNKSHIRIAFFEQRIYIFFDYAYQKRYTSITLTQEVIEEHLIRLAIPLLYILYLYEDTL
jgi:hypothetical protein